MKNQQRDQKDERTSARIDEEEALEAKVRADLEGSRESYESYHGGIEGSYWTFDEYVDQQVRSEIANYHKSRAEKELGPSVIWDQIKAADLTRLKSLLDHSIREQDLHTFLEAHPKFLVQVLAGGHGRYQVSKKRLGSELVTDFLIAEQDSHGMHWYAVELENPSVKVCRKDGRPTQAVHHALDQIRDWRDWLKNNLSYARNPPDQDGLGLTGIDPDLPGLVLIGRRQQFPKEYKRFCREKRDRTNVLIHSYDWLIEALSSNNSGQLFFELNY